VIYLATVNRTSCSLKDNNPFGEVSDAMIELTGDGFWATMVFDSAEPGPSQKYHLRQMHPLEGLEPFNVDCDLSKLGPDHVPDNESVFCFKVYTTEEDNYHLVLKCLNEHQRLFRRIGLLWRKVGNQRLHTEDVVQGISITII
jgi:hypothetical protein